jgi:Tfp pilus assembly protein PilO
VTFIDRKRPWKKLSGGRRTLVFILLLGAVILLVHELVIAPLIGSEKKVRDEIALKAKMLARYEEFIQAGKEIDGELNQITQQVETIQLRLLPGETPQISAASLQEILKKLAEKNGIEIRSFRIGEPKELNFYLKVPVVIDINPTKSMASLVYFLFDIENSEKFLVISELNLTTPNIRNPTEVRGSLTVTGFVKNPNPKGKT